MTNINMTIQMKRVSGVLSGLIALGLAAGGAWAQGVGTTGANFLEVGVGARALGMGSAFTAVADDANAINWNPGALNGITRRDVTASYNSLFQDENQGFVGYAQPLKGGGAMGMALNYLVVSNIQKRAGDTENPDTTFSNSNFALMGSYAHGLPVEGLSLGVNLKYIRTSLDTFSGNAMALDGGLFYKTPIQNLTLGFTMQNLGSKIGPDLLPLNFAGGAAYRMLDKKLVLASDFDWYSLDQREYWNLGAEYWLNQYLAARSGYQFGHGQDHLDSSFVGAAFGLGFKINDFKVDYAFLPFGDLGNTHRVTLGMSF